MYKLVSPRELTEIITGLLLKPELLGELDSPEKHRMFMADLGRVVVRTLWRSGKQRRLARNRSYSVGWVTA